MSGIVGKLSFDRGEPLARPIVEQMIGALRHRGASAHGIYTAPGIALGPVAATNERRSVHVVADAQLTNARELTARLKRAGHTIRRRSDADLIAHAYEQWGDGCVERLRGPFAIAIWDGRTHRLLLARDHAGIRPLYFALLHGHGVVFGSNIAALLPDPGVGREWCPIALDAYLALGYVPAPLTAYERISKLEPAHRLLVEGRRLHLEPYWTPPDPDRTATDAATCEETAAALRTVVGEALERHADTAILYSGGAASCALLASAPSSATSVTVALDQDTTEIMRGHTTACALGFVPRLEVATPEAAAIASRLAAEFDEPIGDPAVVAQHTVLTASRPHTSHAISGHGGFALWSGRSRRRIGRLARWRLSPIVRGARGFWDAQLRHSIYTRRFAWQVRESSPLARYAERASCASDETPEARMAVQTFLPDNAVRIAERTSLLAGIELTFPYLTRDLLELAARTPSSLKQHAGVGLHPLRQTIAARLPPALMPPARHPARHPWLRDALAAMVPAMLLSPRFDGRGMVSRPALRQLWDEHTSGRRDHAHRLWSLLMLEFWFRNHIDDDAAAEPAEYAVLKVA